MALALGIDFGTSGLRGAVVDDQRRERWLHRGDYGDQPLSYEAWRRALFDL